MTEVTKTWCISCNGYTGFIITQNMKEKIESDILRVLVENKDDIKKYQWTINDSYVADGKQVMVCFPYDDTYIRNEDDMLNDFIDLKFFDISECLYTEDTDIDSVKETCHLIATNQIVPEEV